MTRVVRLAVFQACGTLINILFPRVSKTILSFGHPDYVSHSNLTLMVFSRTYRYNSNLSAEDIRRRLTGQHMKVHNLDFEVSEKGQMLRIIPHAEDVESVKTLPITSRPVASELARRRS